MNRIHKSDLIENVEGGGWLTKRDAASVVDAIFAQIMAAVANGNQVAITGFGTFEPRHRAARMGRNIKTGEAVAIAASTTMGFRASKVAKVAS